LNKIFPLFGIMMGLFFYDFKINLALELSVGSWGCSDRQRACDLLTRILGVGIIYFRMR